MSDNGNSRSTSSGGITVVGLLGVAFIVLKLLHKIAWPWIWVLSPFWGGLALGVAIFLILLVVALIATAAGKRKRTRRLR